MPIKFLNDVAVDSSVLYVDTTNDRVGIGTTSLSETFTLQTQATGLGNEGIFIKNPFAGSTPIVNSKSPFLSLGSDTGSVGTSTIYMGRNATATNQESKIEWSNANSGLSIYVAGQGSYREHVRFGDLASSTARTFFNGEVGIGITNPSQKLHVSGNARVTGAYYDSNNSPGTSGQVLSSTATGTDWVDAGSGGVTSTSSSTNDNLLGIRVTPTTGAVTIGLDIDSLVASTLPNADEIYIPYYDEANDINRRVAYADLPTDSRYVAVTGDTMTGDLTMNNSQIQITDSGAQARMSINNTGTGDSQINFQLSGSSKFTIGVDNSDSDKFKISGSSALGSNDRIVVNSSGDVGIGTTDPKAKLDVDGNFRINTNNLTLSNTPSWGVPTQNIIGAEDNTNGATLTLMNTSATIPAGGASGTLQFVALDDGRNSGGSGYATASISAISQIAPGTGQSGQGTLIFKTGGYYGNITEKMRINHFGNVGIGTTTSPQTKLHVANGTLRTWTPSGGTTAIFESTQNSRSFITITGGNESELWFGDGTTQAKGRVRYENNNDMMEFWTGQSAKMYINSSGSVGIGAPTPQSTLQVNGGVQLANDTASPSASKVGTLRYRTSGNNSYVDMCMQTGASTYAWVNIVANTW